MNKCSLKYTPENLILLYKYRFAGDKFEMFPWRLCSIKCGKIMIRQTSRAKTSRLQFIEYLTEVFNRPEEIFTRLKHKPKHKRFRNT